jgi:hypothetical protein
MKLLVACMVLIMCGFAFADSDAIGVLAGTQEQLSLALYNSTGGLDSSGSCSVAILDKSTVIVNSVSMTNNGDGFYSYNWSVPDTSGTYRILMNCTTSEDINYSAGGALYVSPRSFEKTVARGIVLNVPGYEEQYGIVPSTVTAPILNLGWFNISLGAGVLIIIGLLLYNAYRKG